MQIMIHAARMCLIVSLINFEKNLVNLNFRTIALLANLYIFNSILGVFGLV